MSAALILESVEMSRADALGKSGRAREAAEIVLDALEKMVQRAEATLAEATQSIQTIALLARDPENVPPADDTLMTEAVSLVGSDLEAILERLSTMRESTVPAIVDATRELNQEINTLETDAVTGIGEASEGAEELSEMVLEWSEELHGQADAVIAACEDLSDDISGETSEIAESLSDAVAAAAERLESLGQSVEKLTDDLTGLSRDALDQSLQRLADAGQAAESAIGDIGTTGGDAMNEIRDHIDGILQNLGGLIDLIESIRPVLDAASEVV